jgi:hypothetical protein
VVTFAVLHGLFEEGEQKLSTDREYFIPAFNPEKL